MKFTHIRNKVTNAANRTVHPYFTICRSHFFFFYNIYIFTYFEDFFYIIYNIYTVSVRVLLSSSSVVVWVVVCVDVVPDNGRGGGGNSMGMATE